jgi:hypothetical protein
MLLITFIRKAFQLPFNIFLIIIFILIRMHLFTIWSVDLFWRAADVSPTQPISRFLLSLISRNIWKGSLKGVGNSIGTWATCETQMQSRLPMDQLAAEFPDFWSDAQNRPARSTQFPTTKRDWFHSSSFRRLHLYVSSTPRSVVAPNNEDQARADRNLWNWAPKVRDAQSWDWARMRLIMLCVCVP